MKDKSVLFDVREAARYLNVGVGTLRRWAQSGKAEGVKIGSRGDWRFTVRALDRLLGAPAPKEESRFAAIRKLIVSKAKTITREATRRHAKLVGLHNVRIAVLRVWGDHHATLVKEVANQLGNRDQEAALEVFREIGARLGRQAVDENITLEEAVDGMIFLKQAVWAQVRRSGLLATLNPHDFYRLQEAMGTYIDTLTSKIAFAYHDRYVQVQDRESRLAAIVESSQDAIISKSLDGRMLSWNRGARHLFGFTPQEVLGKPVYMIIPPELEREERRILRKVVRGEQISHYVTERMAKNGRRIPISLSVSPIRNQSGEVVAISSIMRDISEQIMAEAKTRESEEKFAKAFNSNPAAMAITTLEDGIFRDINNTWVELLGYGKKESIGMSARRAPIWVDKKEMGRFVTDLKTKGYVTLREEQFRKKNGEIFTAQMAAQLLTVQGEKVVVSTLVDITDRKKAEEALRTSEERMRKLFEANIVGIIYWNINGEITDANDVFLKTVGYTRRDLKEGKIDWVNMTPPEYKAVDEEAVRELNTLGYHHPIEKEFVRKDGKRVHIVVGSTFINHRKQNGVGFVLDISERKKLERMKDEFLGVASHELKTPVTSIKGYTQLLLRRFRDRQDEATIAVLNRMDRQINKLITLISDLVDVTRIESGKMVFKEEYFEFNSLVRETVEGVQLTSGNHRIITELGPDRKIWGDRDRVGQVIVNLLTNAVKYSPHADRVIVRTGVKDKNVSLSVEDFGIGVPREKQERIFERFFRVQGAKEDTYPGLGLGLYISREIVSRLGGTIGVESNGRGSVFSFTLPLRRK